ncbi:MAG: Maf-like protein [Myxococcales bacterium]
MGPRLLLCSASPRRRELLGGLGLRFEVLSPDVDESPRTGEPAAALAERLARDKARAGVALLAARAGQGGPGGPWVALAADTVVAAPGGQILGKPRDRDDARRMLALLSGSEHSVLSGVCAVAPRGAQRSCVVETRVRLRALTEAQLSWLSAGDGDDKAGAYAVQGLAGAFIDRLEGSTSNVVGLPLAETLDLLAWAGLVLPWAAEAG